MSDFSSRNERRFEGLRVDLLGKEVDTADIDRELNAFFATDEGISRASLMNLAVYSEDPEKMAANTEAIYELTSEHACRAILIASQHGGESTVRSWIQAHCSLTGSGAKAVCSEQVSFLLTGEKAGMVRNIVFSHLQADLPLVFWWQGEISSVFEERLYSRIDRFVFDSSEWKDPKAGYAGLVDALADDTGLVLHDFNFTRASSVRSAIALGFDDPATLKRIEDLGRVSLTYHPKHRMCGVIFAVWLASRLGCSLDAGASTADELVFNRPSSGQKTLTVSLAASANEDCRPLASVRMDFEDGHVSVEASGTGEFVRLCYEFPDRMECQELIPHRSCKRSGLIGQILARAGNNTQFTESLPLLMEVLSLES